MNFDFDLEPKKRKASRDRRCLVCKYTNPHSETLTHTCTATIYDKKNKAIDINLCHVHDRFLFLYGQSEFISTFSHISYKFVVSDDDRYTFQMFKSLFERTEKAKKELIFSRLDEKAF